MKEKTKQESNCLPLTSIDLFDGAVDETRSEMPDLLNSPICRRCGSRMNPKFKDYKVVAWYCYPCSIK